MNELKPCPFCGKNKQQLSTFTALEGQRGEHKEYAIFCGNCGASGPNDLGQTGAEEMWNLRRRDVAPDLLAACEAALAHWLNDDSLGFGSNEDGLVAQRLKAAIAKARE